MSRGVAPTDLEQIDTSDTIFSRGYHVGYALGRLSEGYPQWHQRLPERTLGILRKALDGRASIRVRKVEKPNPFSVRFVQIIVWRH